MQLTKDHRKTIPSGVNVQIEWVNPGVRSCLEMKRHEIVLQNVCLFTKRRQAENQRQPNRLRSRLRFRKNPNDLSLSLNHERHDAAGSEISC